MSRFRGSCCGHTRMRTLNTTSVSLELRRAKSMPATYSRTLRVRGPEAKPKADLILTAAVITTTNVRPDPVLGRAQVFTEVKR